MPSHITKTSATSLPLLTNNGEDLPHHGLCGGSEANRRRPLAEDMHPLYFRIGPLNGPQSTAGMYLVVWPEADGNGKWCHNAHPDRMVLDAQAGDVLIHKRQQYRTLLIDNLCQ